MSGTLWSEAGLAGGDEGGGGEYTAEKLHTDERYSGNTLEVKRTKETLSLTGNVSSCHPWTPSPSGLQSATTETPQGPTRERSDT